MVVVSRLEVCMLQTESQKSFDLHMWCLFFSLAQIFIVTFAENDHGTIIVKSVD